MIKLLSHLEPRTYKPGEYILKEDEDVNEMLFITNGVVSPQIYDLFFLVCRWIYH